MLALASALQLVLPPESASATSPPPPAAQAWGENGEGQSGIGVEPWSTTPVLVASGQRSADDSFVQVSVGEASACGVTRSGNAYCWGRGRSGALGNGSEEESSTPVLVAQGARQADDTFISVSVGDAFACGLSGRGKAFCWGENGWGQLGSGNQTNSTTPVAVSGSWVFKTLDVGEVNACGIVTQGVVVCWGWNDYGQFGQNANYLSAYPNPWIVTNGLVSVVVGKQQVCGLSDVGVASCWGSGSSGELGNPAAQSPTGPIAVAGSLRFTLLTAGDGVTCGIATDDSAYCWGANSYGQLGTGNNVQASSPTRVVSNGELNGQAVTAVSAYSGSTCATTASGKAACWGDNLWGQVGNGTQVNVNAPAAVLQGAQGPASPWSQVSAGYNVTCGLSAGEAYCWGRREYGRLGNGTSTTVPSPMPMTSGDMPASDSLVVVDGGSLASCGIGMSGWVYCWGAGYAGALGNGTLATAYAPKAISPGSIPPGSQFASVSAGAQFACAQSTGGSLYCWGTNMAGQLGNGSMTSSLVPTTVDRGAKPIDDTWAAVAVGGEFACAISSSRRLFCWGSDYFGQLGNGVTSGPFSTPQSVTVPGPWKAIATGAHHACAIAIDDSTYCWGWNGAGQLGIGSNTNADQPTMINSTNLSAGEVFRSLAASDSNTCGVTSSARIFCWGANNYGQLGTGSGGGSTVPVLIATPGGVSPAPQYVSVTSGYESACALATSGTAYCWGANYYGQLGDGTYTSRSTPAAASGGPYRAVAAGSYVVNAINVTAPSPPTLTSSTVTQTSATISFAAGDDGGSTITNYQYSLNGGGWTELAPLDVTSPVTITGLTPGTTYGVQLRAVNGLGAGAASNVLSVTTMPIPPTPPAPVTPPGVPVGVAATPGDRSVTLTWSPPAASGVPPASGYQVESTEPGATCTTATTGCSVTGLINGREYAFRVRAISYSAVGAWSAWTAKVTPVGVPSAPSSVVAVAGDGSALVSWQVPGDDGGSPIVNYTVRSSPGDASCTATTRSCEVSGLTNGVTYTFTVVATNAVGSSAASAPSDAVTPERRVEPSILISGSRSLRASGDRVTIIGVTTGLIGSEAQAWVKASGRRDFSRRGEPVVISETERFRWTGTIRRAVQVYFASGDVRSNKITLPRR